MFLVTLNDNYTYTTEAQTKEQIINELTNRGAKEVIFRQSRRSNDSFEFVEIDSQTVAKAFYTQSAQISYLQEVGKL